MATCMAALLRSACRSGGFGDARTRGVHRQELLVGLVPPPRGCRVADLAPRHRPVLLLHGPLREGKTLSEQQHQRWVFGDQPPADCAASIAPTCPAASGRNSANVPCRVRQNLSFVNRPSTAGDAG